MFKTKEAFAINISDYSVEALELEASRGGYAIKSYARALLESGIVEDGKIVEHEKLKAVIQQLLKEAAPQPISSKEVIITLPESKVFSQSYSLPKSLHTKQVPAALFSQAKESIPIDPDLIAADFIEVSQTKDFVEYLFVATYKTLVKEYTEFFQSLHLKISLMTMESLALAAAIVDDSADETVLMLDMGSRTTIASIFKKGNLKETINIGIAGSHITAALAEKLQISHAEAEQKKRTIGLNAGEEDGGVMLIIQGQLQPLKDELLLFIKYYEEKSDKPIDRILLSGGSASLNGLSDYLQSNLGLDVVVAQPVHKYSVPFDAQYLPSFLVVLGLATIAIGGRSHSIDFLSRTDKDWISTKKIVVDKKDEPKIDTRTRGQKKASARAFLLLGVLIIAGALFGGIYWWKNAPKAVDENSLPDIVNVPDSLLNEEADEQPIDTTILEGYETLTFTFSVATGEAQAGIFSGTQEQVQVQGTVTYTDEILGDSADRNVTGVERDELLKPSLVARLWQDSRSSYADDYRSNGRYLLATPISSDILSFGDETDTGDEKSRSLTVTYTILTINDLNAFAEFEQGNIAAFKQVHPNVELAVRQYTYSPATESGVIPVVAVYQFSK